MLFFNELRSDIITAIKQLYQAEVVPGKIVLEQTKKEFEGDATLVVFSLLKISKQSPEQTAGMLGDWLKINSPLIAGFNVIKGFLNLSIKNEAYLNAFSNQPVQPVEKPGANDLILVEYSSPNTNKPLHLGHMRNILLGYSISEILKSNGNRVYKVNIVNDRGIHICKSMLAWQKFGNNETPQSSGCKGDHLAGKYYVEFEKQHTAQSKAIMEKWISGKFESPAIRERYEKYISKLSEAKDEEARAKIISEIKDYAKSLTPLYKEVQQMLRNWEAGDKDTLELWQTMNNWVYQGFDVTYKKLRVDFDKIYYESQTYLLGKSIVEEGLQNGTFYKKSDNSVWVDLKEEGLDEKLLLRADGTSVYITQDLGTAKLRFDDYAFDKMIYVVGNEQEYHFKALKLILKKLGYSWWNKLHHMSYNMVDLPQGKMKSREGTVVDADDLIDETIADAKKMTIELGKLDNFESEEAMQLYHIIGLGALKYFILKVDPEKRMLFNPAESIDINGHTGPFVQYAYARIQSVMRKAASLKPFSNGSMKQPHADTSMDAGNLNEKEKELIKWLLSFADTVNEAADRLSPALIAQYSYEVAKAYNQFYHEHVVVDAENIPVSKFRLALSLQAGETIKKAFNLLGIRVPERM